MITNARVLRPEFVPGELHHREGQIDFLASVLQPHSPTGDNVLISGPSGVGKTTIAKHMVDRFETQSLDARSGYVHCIQDSSTAAALHKLSRDTRLGADLRLEGTSKSTYLNRLREHDGTIICILDEVDNLADRMILQSLYDLANVRLVLICIDEDVLFNGIDSRIRSRLRSMEKLRMESYSHDEVIDILWGRIDAGLRSDRVDEQAVEHIADLAAGDAREAIALLRRSARSANDRITPEVVAGVRTETEAELDDLLRQKLGTHHQILYDIIRSEGEIPATKLRRRYEDRASNPKSRSTRRRYLTSIENYGLIESSGAGKGTVYRATSASVRVSH